VIINDFVILDITDYYLTTNLILKYILLNNILLKLMILLINLTVDEFHGLCLLSEKIHILLNNIYISSIRKCIEDFII